MLTVLKNGQAGRSYNIGGGNECTNLELVHLICKILDKIKPRSKGRIQISLPLLWIVLGMTHVIRSISMIRKELHWLPSVKLDEGLEKPLGGILVTKIGGSHYLIAKVLVSDWV